MTASFREYDTNAEKEIAKFLDKHLYQKPIFSDFLRFTGKEDQLKGKDVSFSFRELNKIIVDEKAQVYYVNKNIPTFAFEIDFLNKDTCLTEGWLFDNKKETEYYLLIWITATKEREFSEKDIISLECILLSRKRIIDFLSNQKLDKDSCSKISENLRKENKDGANCKGQFDSCYFFFTSRLAEQPVNLIVYKQKLKELATVIFEVRSTN